MSEQTQVKELIGYALLIGFANNHVSDARELIALDALAGSNGRVRLKQTKRKPLSKWLQMMVS